ncbi:AAA family ATPase [Sanguibacter antarcticus]|uniref:Pilus assembly protein CpaE n=1 Tax=Sanguibacter antarcticus TaxID=372484 RepID=A0A2A9E919_9MICO|nr:hypothetical protein [Sanguibacter antarcticus]PFG34690.1 pilus assembly protein CpaE [Sanguibacter antarcticus]
MNVKAILVTDDPAVHERTQNLLLESGTMELVRVTSDVDEVAKTVGRVGDVGVVLVDETVRDGQGHALARQLGAMLPLLGLVMLVEEAGPDGLAAAMDVGARSVVARTAPLDELVSRLESVAAWTAAANDAVGRSDQGGHRGRVVAVAGAKGGVGTSVYTLLLSLALARRGAGVVTAVDFDLASGDLAGYLGVSTRKSVVDLAALGDEVSGRSLRETTYPVPGGLRLVPAPDEGEHAEAMSSDTARAIVHALRYESEFAVVDVGSGLDEPRAAVLERADRVVLVLTPDLPALRAARRTLDQWERLAVRKRTDVAIVVNRRTKKDEVTPQVVQRVLGRPVTAVVPDGAALFETAVNAVELVTARTTVHTAVASAALAVVRDPNDVEPPPEVTDQPRRRRPARAARRSERSRRRRGAASPDATTADAESPDSTIPDTTIPDTASRDEGSASDAPEAAAETAPEKAPEETSEKESVTSGSESGQAAVELPFVVLMGLTVFVLCLQAVFWAGGLLAARGAADEGSRHIGIVGMPAEGDDVERARLERLVEARVPSPWDNDVEVDLDGDDVVVTLDSPTVIPGVHLSVDARVGVFEEPS